MQNGQPCRVSRQFGLDASVGDTHSRVEPEAGSALAHPSTAAASVASVAAPASLRQQVRRWLRHGTSAAPATNARHTPETDGPRPERSFGSRYY